jgi:predicted GNAT family acetyltransferase
MVDVIECDPGGLLARGGAWLESEPVLHNVVCTVAQRAAGRPSTFADALWFLVEERGQPVGAAIMTPPFPLALTPMADGPLAAVADRLAGRLPHLSGVSGPGDVASRFGELWCERTGGAVAPGMDQLMYRLDAVVPPPAVDGTLRLADAADHPLLCDWFAAFVAEAGAVGGDITGAVARRIAEGGLYLWEGSTTVTMSGAAPPVAGVVRIGPVYTPPALRRRGYATNCVAALSRLALDRGATGCMLYTDRANPTSNSVYQRIGYRPVGTASERRFRYPES